MRLLMKCFDLEIGKFRGRIQYRADQDYGELLRYWKGVTGLPKDQFYPGYVDGRTVGKVTKRKDYKGVCVLTCPGTHVQLELDAIADIIDGALGY